MSQKPYGCFNHAPYPESYVVQDGWLEINDGFGNPTRCAQWKRVPHVATRACQYEHDPMGQGANDPRCAGCTWKTGEVPA